MNKTFITVSTICLAILAAIQFYVLFEIDRVVLGTDEWIIMPEVDAAFRGEFNFDNYWRPHGGHHIFGYKILFVLNALYLNLNLKWFQYIGASFWILACFVTFYYLSKKLNFGGSRQQIIAALCIVLSFLSPHAWHLQSYSLTSWRVGNILGFVLVFILIDKLIFTKKSERKFYILILLSFLLILYSLFFGRGWGQAMVISSACIMTAYIIYFLCIRKWNDLIWLVIALLVCVVCFYLYRVSGHPLRNIERSTMDIIELFKFSTLLLGNTITFNSISFSEVPRVDKIIYLQSIGVAVLLLYIAALVVYLKNALFKQTIFPIALMLFSGGVIFGIYYGRGAAEGFEQALFPRYMGDTCIGLAAVIALLLSNKWKLPRSIFFNSISVFLIVMHLLAVVNVQKSAKYKHRYFEKSYEALFSNPIEAFKDAKTAETAKCKNYERCQWRKTIDQYKLIPRY